MTSHFVQMLIDALYKRAFTHRISVNSCIESNKRKFTLSITISVNSRFRPYRKFPHLSITNSVTRQGGSINIIQVTVLVYSFTVPALKLMKVKFCLFLATTAHCHDRAAIKIHITHFTRIFNDHLIL